MLPGSGSLFSVSRGTTDSRIDLLVGPEKGTAFINISDVLTKICLFNSPSLYGVQVTSIQSTLKTVTHHTPVIVSDYM
jgi:hypothetical protein